MKFLEPGKRVYYFQTLDPLHVGTGGTRLGRVDNTIARDPATRLPKVPGPGLSGAVKDSYDLKTLVDRDPGRVFHDRRCAGDNGCGEPHCRVCAFFGTAPGEGDRDKVESRRGMLAFRDAHLVAMPVSSLMGPVWVASTDFGSELGLSINESDLGGMDNPKASADSRLTVLGNKLSIGSFLFEKGRSFDALSDEALEKVLVPLNTSFDDNLLKLLNRLIICAPAVFPLLVDTAMEVRTSVTIDPKTGAAKPTKLFTMEAVPAGALFRVAINCLGGQPPAALSTFTSEKMFKEIETKGFPYLSLTGIGGNVTRGFGRVRFLGYQK